MACNGVCGVGNNGFINPPDPNKSFALSQVELAVLDQDAHQLFVDFDVLTNLAKVEFVFEDTYIYNEFCFMYLSVFVFRYSCILHYHVFLGKVK